MEQAAVTREATKACPPQGFRGWLRNPVARKRWRRFRRHRRAWVSLWALGLLYVLSLLSEFLCNDRPLYVRWEGRSFFPVVRFYPEDAFLHNGHYTRPNYRRLQQSEAFREDPLARMIFPPIPYGPYESVDPETLPASQRVVLTFSPVVPVAQVNLDPSLRVVSSQGFGTLLGEQTDEALRGRNLSDWWIIPLDLREAIDARFRNERSPALTRRAEGTEPFGRSVVLSLSAFEPRREPPATVRVILREGTSPDLRQRVVPVDRAGHVPRKDRGFWQTFCERERATLMQIVERALTGEEVHTTLKLRNTPWKISAQREPVRWPHPPVRGHWMGLDSAGRDVLARILYGMRISITFGLLLVGVATLMGLAVGAVQGYYGGAVDLIGQRLIEVWSALPFLYVMMLLGSVYGRGFGLLLVCYGLFNWIGISYYVRAEFLRLRHQPFVDAARCLGVSGPVIILRHIVPNALTPVITFFPFSLVGAIGALAALDYLGFGLPEPTASWGQLLYQAQQYRWAWWLILYPSLALFLVMLMGVFIGEGVREAYDPRTYTRWE